MCLARGSLATHFSTTLQRIRFLHTADWHLGKLLHVEHPTRVKVSSRGGLAGDLQAQSEEEVFKEFAAHVTGEDDLSEGHREVLAEAFERLREEERAA